MKKLNPNRAWKYLEIFALAYGLFAVGVLYAADGIEKYRKKKRAEKERKREKNEAG